MGHKSKSQEIGKVTYRSIDMEIVNHNYLYYDLMTKLAWNPEDLELDSYLHDYASRRYGEKSAGNMVECLRELVESVYGTNDLTTPLYQRRLSDGFCGSMLEERRRFTPHLWRALEIALKDAERQEDNPLYRHDVIDIARQYLGELFNYGILRLYEAFEKGDREIFETKAIELNGIMDSLEKLLSTDDQYCLQPIIDKANKVPGPTADYRRKAKDIITTWSRTTGVMGHEALIDYGRRDVYELVKLYYRKRVKAYLKTLRQRMLSNVKEISLKDLKPIYSRIENEFVDKPFHIEQSERFKGTSIDAAKEVLKNHIPPPFYNDNADYNSSPSL